MHELLKFIVMPLAVMTSFDEWDFGGGVPFVEAKPTGQGGGSTGTLNTTTPWGPDVSWWEQIKILTVYFWGMISSIPAIIDSLGWLLFGSSATRPSDIITDHNRHQAVKYIVHSGSQVDCPLLALVFLLGVTALFGYMIVSTHKWRSATTPEEKVLIGDVYWGVGYWYHVGSLLTFVSMCIVGSSNFSMSCMLLSTLLIRISPVVMVGIYEQSRESIYKLHFRTNRAKASKEFGFIGNLWVILPFLINFMYYLLIAYKENEVVEAWKSESDLNELVKKTSGGIWSFVLNTNFIVRTIVLGFLYSAGIVAVFGQDSSYLSTVAQIVMKLDSLNLAEKVVTGCISEFFAWHAKTAQELRKKMISGDFEMNIMMGLMWWGMQANKTNTKAEQKKRESGFNWVCKMVKEESNTQGRNHVCGAVHEFAMMNMIQQGRVSPPILYWKWTGSWTYLLTTSVVATYFNNVNDKNITNKIIQGANTLVFPMFFEFVMANVAPFTNGIPMDWSFGSFGGYDHNIVKAWWSYPDPVAYANAFLKPGLSISPKTCAVTTFVCQGLMGLVGLEVEDLTYEKLKDKLFMMRGDQLRKATKKEVDGSWLSAFMGLSKLTAEEAGRPNQAGTNSAPENADDEEEETGPGMKKKFIDKYYLGWGKASGFKENTLTGVRDTKWVSTFLNNLSGSLWWGDPPKREASTSVDEGTLVISASETIKSFFYEAQKFGSYMKDGRVERMIIPGFENKPDPEDDMRAAHAWPSDAEANWDPDNLLGEEKKAEEDGGKKSERFRIGSMDPTNTSREPRIYYMYGPKSNVSSLDFKDVIAGSAKVVYWTSAEAENSTAASSVIDLGVFLANAGADIVP